jgi:hypothetical protein
VCICVCARMRACVSQVVRQEGFFSLWKGNLATILHRFPYAAVNFSAFEWAKLRLQDHTSNDVARRLMAGGFAGLIACTAVSAASDTPYTHTHKHSHSHTHTHTHTVLW